MCVYMFAHTFVYTLVDTFVNTFAYTFVHLWMTSMMNVTVCVGTGRGVGRTNGVARADIFSSNTSAGSAVYGSCTGVHNGVSLGDGRDGIDGIVGASVTAGGGCGAGAGW